ncbi:DUF5683 domain-containing protein [Bernardetia sp. OM2101]|uniref:DUF5683 domain-containing protein n=1 Tax=Bernardetia sp. OM2101 TaxID=3344876 RepID=UPI0035CF13B5
MNRLFSSLLTKQKTILAVLLCIFCSVLLINASFGQNTKTDSLTTLKVDSTSQIIIKETVKDSTKTAKKINNELDVKLEPKFKLRPPTRAALLSAALPGAGQYYNKKAWAIKVPVVYALIAVPAYLSITNHANYRTFRENYIYMQDENPATQPDADFVNRSADQVQRQRDSYRRDRDFYMILTGIFYLLNIGEATTTAHFNNFDIDDDISFKFKPQMESIGTNADKLAGVSLVMTF